MQTCGTRVRARAFRDRARAFRDRARDSRDRDSREGSRTGGINQTTLGTKEVTCKDKVGMEGMVGMEIDLIGNRMHSTTRTRNGGAEATTRCHSGRTKTMSTFLPSSSTEGATNATEPELSTEEECRFLAGTAIGTKEYAPSASEEEPTTSLANPAGSAREANGNKGGNMTSTIAAPATITATGIREDRGLIREDRADGIKEDRAALTKVVKEAKEGGIREVRDREDGTREAVKGDGTRGVRGVRATGDDDMRTDRKYKHQIETF